MVTGILLLIGILCVMFISPESTAFIQGAGWHWDTIIRIFSHMVTHANWSHLLGNFAFGIPFMLYAERKVGSLKFLKTYLLCGGAALAAQCLVNTYVGVDGGMIGSSGAIMGIFGFALCIGKMKWHERIVATLPVLFELYVQGVATLYVLQGGLSFVAYGAHLGGLLCGIVLAFQESINTGLKWLISRSKMLLSSSQSPQR